MVGSGLDSGRDFLNELFGRNDRLAPEVTTSLGEGLVLDVESGNSGAFVPGDGPLNIQRISESRVRISDQWATDDARDARRLGRHLGHREEPEVGNTPQS